MDLVWVLYVQNLVNLLGADRKATNRAPPKTRVEFESGEQDLTKTFQLELT
jgi:hypothetical protein